MTAFERARSYVGKMPVSVSGSGGHAAAFEVACVLVKGFSLSLLDAAQLMAEWNARCQPPWSVPELQHKLRQATMAKRPAGYLLSDEGRVTGGERDEGNRRVAEAMGAAAAVASVGYDAEALGRLAEKQERVDMVWLANRSVVDPAVVDSDAFLRMMFRPAERVVVFTDERSQGQAVWPDEPVPRAGTRGMWFLIQPVTGEYVKVARLKGPSRRAEECVTGWRYALVESDEAPVGLWLRWLVRLRLPVAAIYSSGGRSVHALVKVDAGSKGEWDRLVGPLKGALRQVGADAGAMTGVRLSRLPGQWRGEKGMWQRLLYVNPLPLCEAVADRGVVRDVEGEWMAAGRVAWMEQDAVGAARAVAGLRYYGTVRPAMAAAAEDLEAGVEQMAASDAGAAVAAPAG
jgi:hypothetical protein